MSRYLIPSLAFLFSVAATGNAATVAGTTSHHTIATKIIFSRAVYQCNRWCHYDSGWGVLARTLLTRQVRSNHPL